MDLLECSLCNNQYDNSKRRARTLPCIHYFCQDCLDQIIKSATPHCPTCRAHISIQSADMLPPNLLMDNLLIKIKIGLQGGHEGSDKDVNAGSCPKNKKCQLYFTSKTHNVKNCRDCTVIEHSTSKCKILPLEDKLEETKNMTFYNLKTEKLIREKNINDLQHIVTDTESKVKDHIADIGKLQRKIMEKKLFVKTARKSIQDCKDNKRKIENIQQQLISSLTLHQINNSCQEAERIMKVSNSIKISLKRNFELVSSKSFQDLIDQTPDVFENKILQGEVTAYTTAIVNGEKRFSQLLVKNENIHLPALANCDKPPDHENTVTVSSLLTRYPTTNTDMYVTLTTKGKELGTVYVKLMDSDYAKYIKKLCIGTTGPSYRGSVFESCNSNRLFTENVNKYDQSRCSEIPPPNPVKQRAQKGTVFIQYETGLGFWVSSSESCDMFIKIGKVIKGMCILEEASKYPEGEICIKDVGTILK